MGAILKALLAIVEILKLVASDRDGDGRPDLFDSNPDDVNVK